MATKNFSYHFIFYGDSCSGVPDRPHNQKLQKINKEIQRLDHKPDFVLSAGDEIIGLTNDESQLNKQWRYWLEEEMRYFAESHIPIYNCSGNHTVYNEMSADAFKRVCLRRHRNAVIQTAGIAYYIEYPNLLLLFVDTMGTALGGEGRVEINWLDNALKKSKANYKLVIGHHPVFPVNGFSGDYQRNIETKNGRAFWKVLKQNNVFAYCCSHMLAYDVQIHEGILQIMSAGAGTLYRMPPETEYLHFLNCSIDNQGLRYVVIDEDGQIRERFSWPIINPHEKWISLNTETDEFQMPEWLPNESYEILCLDFHAQLADGQQRQQTLLSGWESRNALPLIWIGLTGHEKMFTVYVSRSPGRSPQHWYGPSLSDKSFMEIQIAFHRGMGPGGLLWRWNDQSPWSSMASSTAMEIDKVKWPLKWSIGHDNGGPFDKAFTGKSLYAKWMSI